MTSFSDLLKGRAFEPAIDRYRQRAKQIKGVAKQIGEGKTVAEETDDRLRLYADREKQLAAHFSTAGRAETKNTLLGFERAIGATGDILSIEFFEAGLLAARAVGLISVNFGTYNGTGFLVGNNLLLTNHHVLPDAMRAATSVLQLDLEFNNHGMTKVPQEFELDPDRFYYSDVGLDFALVAVNDTSVSGRALESYGYHPIIPRQGKIRIGDSVNVIQHPQGGMKSVVVHNSNLLHLENSTDLEPYCWYSSDTEPGSSGSPVFNNRWEVVALHHRAVPKMDVNGNILSMAGEVLSNEEIDQHPERIQWEANEGIRASRLVKAIEAVDLENESQRQVRDELILLWRKAKTGVFGLERSRSGDVSTVVGTMRRESPSGSHVIEIDKESLDLDSGEHQINVSITIA